MKRLPSEELRLLIARLETNPEHAATIAAWTDDGVKKGQLREGNVATTRNGTVLKATRNPESVDPEKGMGIQHVLDGGRAGEKKENTCSPGDDEKWVYEFIHLLLNYPIARLHWGKQFKQWWRNISYRFN